MDWREQVSLVLFDFDGLLVDTERLHYNAYIESCREFGVEVLWTFPHYCSHAHTGADNVRRALFSDYPQLTANHVTWELLYARKSHRLLERLQNGEIAMMPGSEALITLLAEQKIPSCVVTHSSARLVAAVRSHNPILNKIPYWLTRDDYHAPKPDPECYATAIARHTLSGDLRQPIGFEDTPRGLRALLGTQAIPILISEWSYPEAEEWKAEGKIHHYSSLAPFAEESFTLPPLPYR